MATRNGRPTWAASAPPDAVSMTTDELRSRLGRVGIWMPPPERTGVDPAATAAAIERSGFTSAWIGGGNATPDAFVRLRPLLAGSENLIVATGIANVWAWEPARMRAEAEGLAAEFPGRFILGLGVSHAPLVASLGHSYLRPLQKMEKFLDELDHPAQRGPPAAADRARGPRAEDAAAVARPDARGAPVFHHARAHGVRAVGARP